MNWKLIVYLSLFGLLMAVGTVYWIPANAEPWLWLVIMLLCAYLIATKAPGQFFLHGFLVCLLNCVWITAAHIILSAHYLASHAEEAKQYVQMNEKFHVTPAQAMLIIGPVIGVLSGLVLGLLSFIASKIFKR